MRNATVFLSNTEPPVFGLTWSAIKTEPLPPPMNPSAAELFGKYICFNCTSGIPMEGKPMYFISVADAGECVHTIFKQPRKYAGKCIGLSSCLHTMDECAQIMEKALNGKATFKATEVGKMHEK